MTIITHNNLSTALTANAECQLAVRVCRSVRRSGQHDRTGRMLKVRDKLSKIMESKLTLTDC